MWCVTVILFGIGNASHFCGWGRKWGRKNKRKRYRTVNIGNTEVYMYSCLDLLPQSIEEIIDKTGMNSSEVYEVLMNLEMDGLVIEPVRNHYARKK